MQRRSFLKTAGGVVMAIGTAGFPLELLASPESPNLVKLTILHTNDVHSRIEPFPMDGSRRAGLGGAARRAALIKKIRSEEDNVLLLDAGDIFQGTPYFNFFGGELEFKLMTEMGYDAATIGNHDFDSGIDGLNKQLPNAGFEFLIANYDLRDTVLEGKTKPYKIFNKKGLKIGVLGIGIELDGLVPKTLTGNTKYLDPIEQANFYANILKRDEGCHYVICLSHLGYKYRSKKVCDRDLAAKSQNIDLILGGHTHSFMKEPERILNEKKEAVLVSQAGWAGILLGRLDVFFERNFKHKCVQCKNQVIK